MPDSTDPVLRGVIRQWLEELPVEDFDALVADVRRPPRDARFAQFGGQVRPPAASIERRHITPSISTV
jgi:hypothetical protein